MGFIGGPDKHAESLVQGRGGYGQIIGGDQPAAALERHEEVRPALGDFGPERDDRHSRDEGVDLGATARRARGGGREVHADQQLRLHYRGQHGGFVAQRREGRLPARRGAFEGDEGTRVDYEAHALSGGRSAALTRSRSSAKAGSGTPAARQLARTSRSDATG